jgi:two-component system sensor kinase FixL
MQYEISDNGSTMRSLKTILASRPLRFFAGVAGIALIAYSDLSLSDAIPLALLYLAPVMVMSSALRRWQIPLLGLLCTVVAEYADAYPWTVRQGIPRDALYFFAYTAAGLYVSEILSRRRTEQTHLAELEAEIEARRGAEEQLSLVVSKSSIAIVTSDDSGTILQANEAAERMFAEEDGSDVAKLQGSSLKVFLPALARVQIRRQGWEHLKTNLQCQGLRANQDPFLADVWVSSYVTTRGGRLTAMIVDSSIDARDREEANLEQVMAGSKLAIGALFHEIRNICAAISVVQQNLRTAYGVGEPSEDFDALQQLVTALERMASLELSLVKREPAKVKLDAFLRELRSILKPSLRETSIALRWQVDAGLPEVWADQQSLLQVFLNLVRNAEKALAPVDHAELIVAASRVDGRVQVRFSDNGPGVKRPDLLFRPFGSNPNSSGVASGLGLYLSRAMMLSFHGDLLYEPSERGATFIVQMMTAEGEA